MRNITTLLAKGNFTPKERVLLIVNDAVSKEQKGKGILSEADKHALIEAWTPKDNNEAREYNRYNNAWRTAGFAEMEAQGTYLQARVSCLEAGRVIDYVLFKHPIFTNKDAKNTDARDNVRIKSIISRILADELKTKTDKEALDLVLKCLGLDYNHTIYLLAFDMAGKDLQKDLLALYPEAKNEQDYLEQEEIIFNLFDGKETLTKEVKEKLAELITDEAYNRYSEEWSFYGYYADLPLIEAGKRLANENGLYKELKAETENDLKEELAKKLPAYAEKHQTTIKELLKDTIIKWLDEGLFIKEYTPLFKSDIKETCNEQTTKLTHKEVFSAWLKTKEKAKETIKELTEKGELKVEKRKRVFKSKKDMITGVLAGSLGEEWGKKQDGTFEIEKTFITGESLYSLESELNFVKDFKTQVESIKLLGVLVLFLRNSRFMDEYAKLLGFNELFERLSKIYEVDLTYRIKQFIASFKQDLERLRMEFIILIDDIQQDEYKADRVYFLTDIFTSDLLDQISPDGVKADMDYMKRYIERLKEDLGNEF